MLKEQKGRATGKPYSIVEDFFNKPSWASKKTATLMEDDLIKMLDEGEAKLNEGLPSWFQLYLDDDPVSGYPYIGYKIKVDGLEEYDGSLYAIDSGTAMETIKSFREKGDTELADKLDPDARDAEGTRTFDSNFENLFWRVECLNSLEGGMSWGEWAESIWYNVEPWLLENGVSQERANELGEELSGKSSTASIRRIQKKAARLGQWDFDQHEAIWKLEAGEDGKKKLVRVQND
jgi:hypothetical protein